MSRATRSGCGRPWRYLPWLLLFLCASAPTVLARSHRSKEKKEAARRQAALEATEAGVEALAAHDFRAALRSLQAAYRKFPNPETLFQLGQLAEAEGRKSEAQDLLRRFLADPTIEASSPHYQAAKAIAERPRGPSGELDVVGEQGTIVLLDGRVVGVLPLGQPILLPLGQHQVSLESDGKTLRGEVSLPNGRGAVMRFSEASNAVLLTLPPPLLVVVDWTPIPLPLRPQVEQLIARAARGSGLMPYRIEVALAEASLPPTTDPAECWGRDSCRGQLLRLPGIDHVLRLEAPGAKSGQPPAAFDVALFEPPVPDAASRQEVRCDGCSSEQLQTKLGAALEKLFGQGVGKLHGQLEVTTLPLGAEVSLDGRVVGRTPWKRAIFVGAHQLSLALPGYQRQSMELTISEGQTATKEITMSLTTDYEPEPAPLDDGPVVRAPRPRWRYIAGGAAIGVGIGLLGVGAWPLSLDGQCQSPAIPPATQCLSLYDTRSPGLGLALPGAGLIIGGAILMLVPGRRLN